MSHIRKLNIRCPKCRTDKEILANEVIEAFTEFRFKDGKCDEGKDCANEFGLGLRVEFVCKNCGHTWIGRKGASIDSYSEYDD